MDYHNHIHIHIHMLLILTICCLLLLLPKSHCEPWGSYNDSVCKERPYNCGTLLNISYPFWGQNLPAQCGGGDPFKLTCNHGNQTTSIEIGSHNFTVKNINMTNNTMILVRPDLALDLCSPQFGDTYLSPTLFMYPPSVYNITVFYNCSTSLDPPRRFGNFTCGGSDYALFREGVQVEILKKFPWLTRCGKHLQVPVDTPYDYVRGHHFLEQAFRRGFPVIYTDPETLDGVVFSFIKGIWIGFIVILVLFMTCIGMSCVGIYCCCCKHMSLKTKVKAWLMRKNELDIEAFLKNNESLAQKRYKYSEIKKMTKSFKVKLGEGGFGAVYKGELLSGCSVAVKMLNASKGNGEDFMNEVASISRTSHVNVVSLLGFCLEGSKKALIYEFMANGSLDMFIYNKGLETTESLSWDSLWQIAVGIARGLEYLHRGCNTRILHFDIKPHNILLDGNFCPKISDFGLAKLCPRRESIISMSDARGTLGYVAPEVWNRNFGGISYKSDVYSYGMMLLEMVGGRKNISAEASNTSEIYFPDWIYKRLEQGGDLRPDGVMAAEENEIARRMTVVGLWCVQTFPKDRPTMSSVVDMLEDNKYPLEMPPKPVLSSPTRPVVPESTTSSL